MRFNKELSRERLSLLSPEERALYMKERAAAKSVPVFEGVTDLFTEEEMDEDNAVLDENSDDNTLTEMVSDDFVIDELTKMYLAEFVKILPYDEFCGVRENLIDMINTDAAFDDSKNTPAAVNEAGAEGQDAFAWIQGLKLGWLGKLAAAGLGLLGTAIAYLLVVGKDKLAMEKLKYYMNRLVEITDQGVHKKKPWYSYLFPGSMKQNMGEYNTGCFRTIQETADRNMTNSVMNAAHKLGYFSKGNMMEIASAAGPQEGGGLYAFHDNVLSKCTIIAPTGDTEQF